MVSTIPVTVAERGEFMRMALQHFTEVDTAFIPQNDWEEHFFETIMANPQYFLRWIVSDGIRAGFILFGIEKHRFLPRKTGVLYDLFVLPEFRRHGVARACAIEVIRELWTYAPSKIQLEVVEGQLAASALWNSLGFKKITGRYVLTGNQP